jgi:hypothetical protein
MLKRFLLSALVGSTCLAIETTAAEQTDATLTFGARPPLREKGHSTTLGHAFLIIGLKTNHGIKEEIFGFYPVKNSLKGVLKGPGMLKSEERCGPDDDCGPKHVGELRNRLSEVTQSVTVPITLDQVKTVYGVIRKWDSQSFPDPNSNRQIVPSPDVDSGSSGDYRVFDRNCIDFIAAVATQLGYPTPDRSNLQTAPEFLSAFKPLVDAEEKTRAAQRDAEISKERESAAQQKAKQSELAKERAEEQAKQSDLARQDAEEDAAEAYEKAKRSEQARLRAEQKAAAAQSQLNQAIPSGWVRCDCPSVHAQYGKYVNGVLWHSPSINRCL